VSTSDSIRSFLIQTNQRQPEIYKQAHSYTDKKEYKIFLTYKEIQSGAVAKSYMRKGFPINEEICKYFPIYEEVVSQI
jgi:hypothetical protein